MTQKIFVISDTHFGHSKILSIEPKRSHFKTIKEHDDFIVDCWNSTVNKKDTVIHLGDVLFGSHSFEVLERLNGYKRLVLGNHDVYSAGKYLEYFNGLHGAYQYKGSTILTHIPVHQSQMENRFKLNIHGHLHNETLDDERYFCCSCERINFTPKLISDLI